MNSKAHNGSERGAEKMRQNVRPILSSTIRNAGERTGGFLLSTPGVISIRQRELLKRLKAIVRKRGSNYRFTLSEARGLTERDVKE